jgi:N,N'-diacetyllegionaminate synthase
MEHIIVIAEAGVNHNGKIENAFKLVDAAAEAGADYIKFQTFKAEKTVSIQQKKPIIKYKIHRIRKKVNWKC